MSEEVLWTGKWLSVCKKQDIEYIARSKSTQDVTGVGVLAIVHKDNQDFVIVNKEFKAPAGKWILTLASGMMDPHESNPSETAVRELKEESGYTASSVDKVTEVSLTDPGKITESMRWVYLSVDGDHPDNINPKRELQGSENIEHTLLIPLKVIFIPLNSLKLELDRMIQNEDCGVDARLYTFATGIGNCVTNTLK